MLSSAAMRAWIYDRLFGHLTARWYAAVLSRLADGARVLDVGIGPGAAVAAHADAIRRRGLSIVGLDVDPTYVARCRARLQGAGLEKNVVVRLEPVEVHRGGPYDAVYFSASFMLLADPRAALRHVEGLLAPGGRVFFTQTFEHERSRFMEWLKPRLGSLTTIEFGRVTYRDDFDGTLEAEGYAALLDERLSKGRKRSAWLVVARPPSSPRTV